MVRSEGQELLLCLDDLAKLKRHEQRVSQDGASQAETVLGVLLWDLLQLAKIPSAAASGRQRAVMYVKLTGADGQNAAIAQTEIDPSFSRRVALVANRRNDKPLDSVVGPWRVFPPDDIRHARWFVGWCRSRLKPLSERDRIQN